MGDWVHSLAPWQVISHLTFSWQASIWSAQRCYEKFMRTEMRGVSYFDALEENIRARWHHAHAFGVTAKASRGNTSGGWFEHSGRNRIEPVNKRDDVADYCAKYACKEGAWWDVKPRVTGTRSSRADWRFHRRFASIRGFDALTRHVEPACKSSSLTSWPRSSEACECRIRFPVSGWQTSAVCGNSPVCLSGRHARPSLPHFGVFPWTVPSRRRLGRLTGVRLKDILPPIGVKR